MERHLPLSTTSRPSVGPPRLYETHPRLFLRNEATGNLNRSMIVYYGKFI